MNGSWPISPARGYSKYLRRILSFVEGWVFTEPFTPVFSVDGFHWGDDLGIVQATQNIVTGAASATITLSVPSNESWLVLGAVAQLAAVPAGQAIVGQVRLAIRMDNLPMPVTEAVNGTTRCGAQSIWMPPYPMILHPGDALSAQMFNGHTADLTGTLHALRRRIPTSSNP